MYILKKPQQINQQQTNPTVTQADSHLETNCSSCLFIKKTKIAAKLCNLGSTTVLQQVQEYSVLKHAGTKMI